MGRRIVPVPVAFPHGSIYERGAVTEPMATEATFTVPSDQFPLGTVFNQLPGVKIELERVVHSGGVIIPYFWVRGTAVEDIESAFEAHPGVKNIKLVDSVADEYLLRVEWVTDYDDVLTTLTETNIVLTEAVGTNQQWTFKIRGENRSSISEFQTRCRELGIPITLTELHALTTIETATEAALTETQQEALVLAYDRGYFESPREVTMEELGQELGITQQAVASRLRRGINHILGNTLSALTPPPR
jgi:predicted DNA binding protein